MHRLALFILAAVAAPAQAPPAFRLPDNVTPVCYALDLRLSPADEKFSGTVEIAVNLLESVSTIWLHAAALAATEVRVQAGGQPARISPRALSPRARNFSTSRTDNFFLFFSDANKGNILRGYF